MISIAVISGAGGTGKSSLCAHLSTTLATMGHRVLVIDMGLIPTTTAMFLTGWKSIPPEQTALAILGGPNNRKELIQPTWAEGVDIVPGIDADYHAPDDPHRGGLRDFLVRVAGDYHFALIDTPPRILGISSVVAASADWVAVPVRFEGLEGIPGLRDVVRLLDRSPARFLGYLPWGAHARRRSTKAFEAAVRRDHGDQVFKTVVPFLAAFPRAIERRQALGQMEPGGAAARAMEALSAEVMGRIGLEAA